MKEYDFLEVKPEFEDELEDSETKEHTPNMKCKRRMLEDLLDDRQLQKELEEYGDYINQQDHPHDDLNIYSN